MNESIKNNPEDLSGDTPANDFSTLAKEVPYNPALAAKARREAIKDSMNPDAYENLRAEQNIQRLNQPTLKEGYLDSLDMPLKNQEVYQRVADKLSAGMKLQSEDILTLAKAEIFQLNTEGADDFLRNLGVGEGTNYDVSMPTVIEDANGNMKETPMEISFIDSNGEANLIQINKNLTYNKETGLMEPNSGLEDGQPYITAYKGEGLYPAGGTTVNDNNGQRKVRNLDPTKRFSQSRFVFK